MIKKLSIIFEVPMTTTLDNTWKLYSQNFLLRSDHHLFPLECIHIISNHCGTLLFVLNKFALLRPLGRDVDKLIITYIYQTVVWIRYQVTRNKSYIPTLTVMWTLITEMASITVENSGLMSLNMLLLFPPSRYSRKNSMALNLLPHVLRKEQGCRQTPLQPCLLFLSKEFALGKYI